MTGAPFSAAELSHLLEIYLAGINDTVIITDGELRDGTPGPMIKYINAAVTTVTSHRAEALLGHPLATLYSREIFSQVWEQLETIAENRRPMQHELQALDRDGHEVWLQVNTLPIFDTNGRLLHFIRIGRDITARKRIEQERETTQRLLATVFGVIDQALGVVDHAGNFSLVNTAMTRRLGWSVLELIGKPFTNVIEESSRKWLIRNLAAREELEQTCRLDTGLLHRNGTIIPGEIVSTITMMEQEERQYRVITFQPKAAAAAASSQTSLQGPIQAALRRDGSPADIIAGKVALVGLAAVRDALGERWPEVSADVFALAEQVLRRHLGPNDSCHRTADDGFLVCFAELSEAEAQDKAQIIADQIRGAVTTVVPEMASARVEGYAAKVSIDSSETGSDETIIQALGGRLARERNRLEGGAIAVLRGGLADAQVVYQRVRTDTNQLAPFSMGRLPKPLEAALDTLRALDRPDYGLESELLLLTAAAERLLIELTETRTDLILVPVRMSTLVQRRDSERWLPIARSMAAPGKRRLVIEITGLARDTARSRLTDMMMMMSSLCRAVAFELPVAETSFVQGLPTTAALVTIPAHRLGNEDGTGQIAAASKLTKALQLRNCRLLVKNIASPVQAMSLAKAGVPLLLTQQEVVAQA